jgi:hypothetical protein
MVDRLDAGHGSGSATCLARAIEVSMDGQYEGDRLSKAAHSSFAEHQSLAEQIEVTKGHRLIAVDRHRNHGTRFGQVGNHV